MADSLFQTAIENEETKGGGDSRLVNGNNQQVEGGAAQQ